MHENSLPLPVEKGKTSYDESEQKYLKNWDESPYDHRAGALIADRQALSIRCPFQ
jgi:hypothetical protein